MLAALVVDGKDTYELTEVPIPELSDELLLVKIGAAGLCHTDIQVLEKDPYQPILPIVGSHEPAGTVVKVGSKVKGFKVGDRVGIACNFGFCGDDGHGNDRKGGPKCKYCSMGEQEELFCTNPSRGSHGVFNPPTGMIKSGGGGFAEYALSDPYWTVLLPESLSFVDAAPLQCAGATIYPALEKSGVSPGDWISIQGLGGLGHLGVQMAVAMGMKVLGIDVKQSSIVALDALPSHLKPHALLNTYGLSEKEIIDKVRDLTDGERPAATVVATDALPAFEIAAKIVRPLGNVVVVGLPTKFLPISAHDLVFRGVKVFGSLHGDKKAIQRMVELVADKGISVHTTTYALEDINEAVKFYRSGEATGRLVVDTSL